MRRTLIDIDHVSRPSFRLLEARDICEDDSILYRLRGRRLILAVIGANIRGLPYVPHDRVSTSVVERIEASESSGCIVFFLPFVPLQFGAVGASFETSRFLD